MAAVATGSLLSVFLIYFHDYIPVLEDGEETREGLIRKYFNLGFPYHEILVFLSKFHGIMLSLRHVKRLLKTMGLRRRCEGKSNE